MRPEIEQAMQQFATEKTLDLPTVARASELQFCRSIQGLVAQGNSGLAQTLADAGLSFYPQSESILELACLIAMTQKNWSLAAELLEDLRMVQHDAVPTATYRLN